MHLKQKSLFQSNLPKTFKGRHHRSRVLLESLEGRTLMTVYNPTSVAPVVLTESSPPVTTVVARFDSFDPIGNLSATVDWPAGTTTATPTAGTINLTGSEFVPGVGNVPQYSITTTITPNQSTVGNQPQFTVTISDSADATSANVVGNIQILDVPLTLSSTNPSPTATAGVPLTNFPLMIFTGSPTLTAADYTGTIDWGDGTPLSAATFTDLVGSFFVNGSHVYATAATPDIVINITSSHGGSLDTTVTGMVVSAAVIGTPTGVPITGAANSTFNNVLLGTFVDPNPLATPIDFSTSIDYGDGTATDVGIVSLIGSDGAGGALFGVYGTHTFTTASVTPYTITAVVTDNTSLLQTTINTTASISSQIPVDTLAISPAPIILTEGSTLPAGTNFGSFIDNAGIQAGVTYTATALVNGTSVPLTVTQVGTSSNYILISTSNTTIATGLVAGTTPYTLTVTNNSDGAAATAAGSITITDAPLTLLTALPSLAATEGTAITPTLITFSDGNPLSTASDFTAVIDWGDGSPTTVGTVTAVSGHYAVSGTHTYHNAASLAGGVTVTVSDLAGSSLTANTGAVTVAAPAYAQGAAISITATIGTPLNNVRIAQFTDANTLARATDFAASVTNWGDGTGSPATVVLDSISGGVAHFSVYASHTYSTSIAPGSTIHAQIQDLTTGAAPLTTTAATLAIDAATISVTAAPVTATAGASIPAGTVFGTFIDDGGPQAGVTYTASALVSGITIPLTVTRVTGSTSNNFILTSTAAANIGALSVGSKPFSLSVSNSNGAAGAAAGSLTVGPAVLAVVSTTSSIAATEGAPLTGTPLLVFSDADTHIAAGQFVATIDWGDGSPDTVGTIVASGGQFSVLGTHTYIDASSDSGDKVSVLVTDPYGQRIAATIPFSVADAALNSATPANVHGVEGIPLDNVLLATFVDANPLGTADDFSATINWGDGATGVHGLITRLGGSNGGSLFGVYGTHTYALNGATPFPISIAVADSGGSTISLSTAADIVNLATFKQVPIAATGVSIHATKGVLFTGKVATFSSQRVDSAKTYFHALIGWGDGTASVGVIVSDKNGNFHVIGSHRYKRSRGIGFPITVRISEVVRPKVVTLALATATVTDNSQSSALKARDIIAQLNH